MPGSICLLRLTLKEVPSPTPAAGPATGHVHRRPRLDLLHPDVFDNCDRRLDDRTFLQAVPN